MNDNYFTLINNELFKTKTDIIVYLAGWEINPYSNAYDRIDDYSYPRSRVPKHLKIFSSEYDKAMLFDRISIEISDISKKSNYRMYVVKAPADCKGICLKTELLAQCYKACLKKASDSGVRSIMIDMFAAGRKGYDPLQAYFIARKAINEAMQKLRKMTIFLNVDDTYIFSKLNRFEAFLKTVNDEDIRSDINKTLELIEKFDCEENKLMLSIMEPETEYAAAVREINELYSECYTQMSAEEYYKHMIAETINKWLNTDNDEYSGGKYEHKQRSSALLAKLIDISPSTVTKLTNEKGGIPTREMLISLAIGMKLNKKERLKFVLYSDPGRMYPDNEKEKYIESLLNENKGEYSYNDINTSVFNKFGETIRKTVERGENTVKKKKAPAKSKEKEK
ncbi:hypothetical protein SAMN02910317_00088 [Ruminococcaceae bacterium FB2012]|nr:hypothetical protein SAMN02910317_00088 [Ruminococcaceae bacterium FB2012]